MDRVRAERFAFRSLEHIEQYAGMDPDEICDDNMSTSVIGIKGAKVLFSPMEAVEKKVRLSPNNTRMLLMTCNRRLIGIAAALRTSTG
jgi:hypothetical protein